MSLYSKVDRRIWIDSKFRSLSQDAKFLWIYFLTCPENGSMPGLMRIGKLSLAESLEWSPERLAKPFGELFANGMAKADWEARFVYLPNALKYNPPPNSNVIIGWVNHWESLPECPLKIEAYEAFLAELERLAKPYAERFQERLAKPYAEPSRNRMPTQDQDQDQDQEQESMPAPRASQKPSEPSPEKPEKPKAKSTVKHSLPSGWAPKPSHFDKAKAIGTDCKAEAEAFKEHHVAKGNKWADWDMAFFTWLRNSEKFGKQIEPEPESKPRPIQRIQTLPGYEPGAAANMAKLIAEAKERGEWA